MFFTIGEGSAGFMMGISMPSPTFPFMLRDGGDSPSSDCGAEFDAYVKQAHGELSRPPFMFGPMAVSRDLEFWKGRRLRFYRSNKDVVEAKVVAWNQSGNTRLSDRFPFETCWDLQLEGDLDLNATSYTDNDQSHNQVTISKPRLHDGKTGRIVQFLSEDRYKIQLDEDPLKFITTHKDNVIRTPSQYNFYVYRMNVHGGGILRRCGCAVPTCQAKQYSIEWIDPPSPDIDLYRSVAKATCPTCRAVEPTARAFDDRHSAVVNSTSPPKETSQAKNSAKASSEDNQECCPICDMEKPLRTLQCRHQLCQDCWSKWRVSATSMMPFGVTQPEIDDKTLQKERDRAYQKMKALLPYTTLGGTATRAPTARQLSSNCVEVVEQITQANRKAIDNFFDRLSSLFSDLDDTLHAHTIHTRDDGSSCLLEFWRELRKAPVHLFCFDGPIKDFLDECYSMAGLEIIAHVIQERWEEIEAFRLLYLQDRGSYRAEADDDKNADNENLEVKAKGYLYFLMSLCHTRMGELYDNDKDYRSAMYWYERALFPSLQRLEMEGSSSKHATAQVATRYNNLGLATRRAGNLLEAQKHYDTALTYTGLEKLDLDNLEFDQLAKSDENTGADYLAKTKMDIDCNLWTLNKEKKQWTGSSGKLTPGC